LLNNIKWSMPMLKAVLGLFALVAAASLMAVSWWLGKAGLGWIEAHREVVALTQPWLFPAILTMVAISTLRRSQQGRA